MRDVVGAFNERFLGQNGDGLIRRERWFPQAGLLERLMSSYELADLYRAFEIWRQIFRSTRFAAELRFSSHHLFGRRGEWQTCAGRSAFDSTDEAGAQADLRRRYGGRRAERQCGWGAVYRHRGGIALATGRSVVKLFGAGERHRNHRKHQ